MTHPVKGIDHCFALVDDLDAAAAQYRALGFTVSPRGIHSVTKGSANHTIMFPDDYFELLGIMTPTEGNANRREMLATKGQGLHAIACRIDNAEDAAEALRGLGISTEGLGSFSRPVPLSDGSEGIAAFTTVAFTSEEVPFGSVFMCQHKTRETVWQPELLNHKNTACGLSAVLAISEVPEKDATNFARLWAGGAVTSEDGFTKVSTGPNSAPLILATADQMTRAYPALDLAATAQGAFTALRVKVKSLDATKVCLTDANLNSFETAHGIAVSATSSAGVIVEFVPT